MSTFSHRRLLSIDDDKAIAALIQATLEKTAGWSVLVAHSGHHGIVKALEYSLDAILLDGHMPGMDGIATLHQLRKHPKTIHVPVVFLTATPDFLWPLRQSELGVRGILTKPFDPCTLAHQIAHVLGWQ